MENLIVNSNLNQTNKPIEEKPISMGLGIGVINLIMLLFSIYQMVIAGKSAVGFETYLVLLVLSFILSILGVITSVKDIHKGHGGSAFGLFLNALPILFFVVILMSFLSGM